MGCGEGGGSRRRGSVEGRGTGCDRRGRVVKRFVHLSSISSAKGGAQSESGERAHFETRTTPRNENGALHHVAVMPCASSFTSTLRPMNVFNPPSAEVSWGDRRAGRWERLVDGKECQPVRDERRGVLCKYLPTRIQVRKSVAKMWPTL